VIVDSLTAPRWVEQVILDVAAAEFAEIVLIAVAPPRHTLWRKARSKITSGVALFSLYERLDKRLFRRRPDALARADLSRLAESTRVVRAGPNPSTDFAPGLSAATIDTIRDEGIDVALALGDEACDELASAARYGVWRLHHGDNRAYRGGPALFWEMYDHSTISETVLEALTIDATRVIYRSFSVTDPVSLYRSRNATYWKSAQFFVRRLRDLDRRGWEYICSGEGHGNRDADPGDGDAHLLGAQTYGSPSNAQLIGHLVRLALGLLRRRIVGLVFRDEWFLAYRRRQADDELSGSGVAFETIEPPANRFYADPFVIEHGGAHWLLFEDYSYSERKAVIAYALLEGGEQVQRAGIALECEHHLSYPFVFAWDGEIYMLPEMGAAQTVDLYRATEFPHRWERERTLISGTTVVDPTLLVHDGLFWLFANVPVAGATVQDELCLFWSTSLAGEWEPHPANPIVSDVRRARPAGRIFRHDGHLIRPAQDCSFRYGRAVVLNRIERLTRDDYHEVTVGRIDPDWMPGIVATHTYDANETYEVRDASKPRVKAFGAGRP